MAGSDDRRCPGRAEANADPIDTDAARAAAIIERILSRCPELIRADLLLVARLLADRQRVNEGPAPRKPRAKRSAPARPRVTSQ
ncbi:MAG: hypothetical protein WB766_06390 [Roseiarcus sp.]